MTANIVFPYLEYDEKVYWQKRNVSNKVFEFPPESPGIVKSDFLYGFDNVIQSTYLVLTEAIFCALTICDQTCAIGGAEVSDNQVKKIKALNPKDGVILAIDNDSAGLKSLVANYKKISKYFPVMCSIPPIASKDWNGMAKETDVAETKKYFEDHIERVTPSLLARVMSNINW